ncbi:hypothetical protein DPMN_110732 [Dreissena polymorpha]|uniref:Uncharacterized protein n=1 Tax=Dreissena polymorpha TaxID=45954 RepID=A0A9D4QN65_DREPO|nr:hypothetical protein DPMN_110732 [Dreissena polymorpha]
MVGEDYASSVLLSQPQVVVRTPASKSTRKRMLSAPDLEGTVKKPKTFTELERPSITKAGRNLQSSELDQKGNTLCVADVHVPIMEKPDFEAVEIKDLAKMMWFFCRLALPWGLPAITATTKPTRNDTKLDYSHRHRLETF